MTVYVVAVIDRQKLKDVVKKHAHHSGLKVHGANALHHVEAMAHKQEKSNVKKSHQMGKLAWFFCFIKELEHLN